MKLLIVLLLLSSIVISNNKWTIRDYIVIREESFLLSGIAEDLKTKERRYFDNYGDDIIIVGDTLTAIWHDFDSLQIYIRKVKFKREQRNSNSK